MLELFAVMVMSIIAGGIVSLYHSYKACKMHKWSTEFGTDTMICMDCGYTLET